MAIPKCFLLFLTVCATLSGCAKIYQSRSAVLRLLSGSTEEGPLFFTDCEMNNNAKACRLAFDNDTSKDWSQCATTTPEPDNITFAYWRGYLQTPAYVTNVHIKNADWTNIGEMDALLDFTISGNGDTCYNHLGEAQFDEKNFPCDILADDIEIRANLATGTVLALCEVHVFGVPIQFPTELGEPSRVGFSDCEMSSVTRHCYLAFDKNIDWVEDVEKATCAQSLEQSGLDQWWKAIFNTPSLVQSVTLFNRNDNPAEKKHMNNFEVNISKRRCGRLNNADGFDRIEFSCNMFGGDIEVRMLNKGKTLTLCEVEIIGHLAQLHSEQRRKPIGCFPDKPEDPDLAPFPHSISYMSVNKCDKICRREKKKFFGLQSGMECWCGDRYGKHEEGEIARQNQTSVCLMPCEGAKLEKCGGMESNEIYELIYDA